MSAVCVFWCAILVPTSYGVFAQEGDLSPGELAQELDAASRTSEECIILLHGLARSEKSMRSLNNYLSKEYRVVNEGYNSRKDTIQALANRIIPASLELCGDVSNIHFVTHSLGGILVRQYLSENTIDNLGRVVMLGPPNKGSEVVDKLGNVPGFKLINGVAGLQLGTDKKSVPNQLGDCNFDLGIIAGKRSFNPLLSSLIPGKDDGKVSIERTRLDCAQDHIVVPVTHTFMMNNKRVHALVSSYLLNGCFECGE